MRIPVPERLREHARGYTGTVAEARHASTIIVVRDGAAGIEAYLLRRQTSMAFAAGMYVFPGGGIFYHCAEEAVQPPSSDLRRVRKEQHKASGF